MLRGIRGIERRNRNENVFLRPNGLAKTLKLRFRVGDLTLPERRRRYTSSREEKEVDAQMCPCGKTIESRTHIVRECEVFKGERDVLKEETREIDECDMEDLVH